MKEYGLFIDGKWIVTDDKIGVINKATGKESAFISVAGQAEVTAAVDAAEKAFQTVKMESYQRYEILMKASQLLMINQKKMAMFLSEEVGKPL